MENPSWTFDSCNSWIDTCVNVNRQLKRVKIPLDFKVPEEIQAAAEQACQIIEEIKALALIRINDEDKPSLKSIRRKKRGGRQEFSRGVVIFGGKWAVKAKRRDDWYRWSFKTNMPPPKEVFEFAQKAVKWAAGLRTSEYYPSPGYYIVSDEQAARLAILGVESKNRPTLMEELADAKPLEEDIHALLEGLRYRRLPS